MTQMLLQYIVPEVLRTKASFRPNRTVLLICALLHLTDDILKRVLYVLND